MKHLLLLAFSLLVLFPGDAAPRVSAAPTPSADSGDDSLVAKKKENKKGSAKKKSAKRKKPRRKSSLKKKRSKRRKPAKKNIGKKNTANKKRSKNARKRPGKNTTRKKPGNARPKPKLRTTAKKKDDGVRVKTLTWKQTASLVARQKGKVVVVDLWATWCAPCKKEFPELVALQKSYPKTVVCLSFNVDNDGEEDTAPAKTRTPVLAFLKKMNARLINVISKDPTEKVFATIGTDSVPTILVYGRDGKLARKFDAENVPGGDKKLSYEKHIVPFVKTLLAK